jgi:peptidoglycan/LPS O-acetylase OafA/YrhL
MTAAHREKSHVLPLDSLRGIAAVSVVIHHVILMPPFLAAFPQHAWIDCSFFHSGWLLVDFFFVLSGVVMSLGYVKPDAGIFSLREFMVRRLARVYPLHIVMLLAILLFRFVRLGLVTAGVMAATSFAFEVNNGYSFFLNVLLLHSLGFLNYLGWNAPSWSISVEFYTYLIFGLALLLAHRLRLKGSFYWISIGLSVGCWLIIVVVLGKQSLELQNDFGLLRCIVSFFLGVLTVKLVSGLPQKIGSGLQGGIQFCALVMAIAHVSLVEAYPWISFFAPLTFAIFLGSILAFPDAAVMPRILAIKPLVWLGQRSYSVYMVHAFVVLFDEYFVRALGPRPIAGLDSICFGLAATLNLLAVLAAVILMSNVTYRYVELPGGRLLKHIFRAAPDFSTPLAAHSTRPSN